MYVQAATGLLPIPVRIDPIALRLAGWHTLAAEVNAVRQQSGASFVAADQYAAAAKLARALPASVAVIGVEPRWSLFNLPTAAVAGQTGILVHSGGDDVDRTPWSSVAEIGQADRRQGTTVVEAFRLFKVTGAEDNKEAVLLPSHADAELAR